MTYGIDFVGDAVYGSTDTTFSPMAHQMWADSYTFEDVVINVAVASEYVYTFENITTASPVPHIWYITPTTAEADQTVTIIGTGFGIQESTFMGEVIFGSLFPTATNWQLVPATSHAYTSSSEINPVTGELDPEHNSVSFIVPIRSVSAGVKIRTIT